MMMIRILRIMYLSWLFTMMPVARIIKAFVYIGGSYHIYHMILTSILSATIQSS